MLYHLLALNICLFSLSLFAQDILVQAERIPKLRDRSTQNVTQLSREDFLSLSGRSLSKKFEFLPGFYSSTSGGLSGTSTLFYRGLGRGHTQFLFEGFKLKDSSDIDSNFQFQHLGDSLYGAGEILRGGSNHLAGSEAMAGIVSLESSQDNFTGISLGSNSTLKAYGNLYQDWSSETLTVSMEALDSKGESVFNHKRVKNAQADGTQKFNGHLIYKKFLSDSFFSLLYKKTQSQYEIDSGFPLTDTVLDDHESFAHNLLGLKYEKEINSKTMIKFKSSKQSSERNSTGDEFSSDDYEMSSELLYLDPVHSFSIYLEGIDSKAFVSENFKKSRTQGALAGDYFFKGEKLFSELNIRGDFYEKHKDALTYQLALGWGSPNYLIKVSHKRGFKAPTLYQLYSKYGKTDLSPTQMITHELTSKFFIGQMSFEQTIFYLKTFDGIDFDSSENRYQNVRERLVTGSESALVWKKNGKLVNISYTYQLPRESNDLLSRVPKKIAKFRFQKKYFKWILSLSGQYIGSRFDRGRMPSFTTFNTVLSKTHNTPKRTYRASLNIKNILDKDYERVRRYGGTSRTFEIKGEMTF